MIEKLKTVAWFARRPRFWPHMAALTTQRLGGATRHEAQKEAAAAWAAERAVDIGSALAAIGVVERDPRPLDPALIDDGERRAVRSGVRMGGPGDLDLIHRAVRATGARRMVETGVAYGWSSLAALAALRDIDGRLVSVDMPYPKMGNEAFVGIVVPPEWRTHWTLIREPDRHGLRRALAAFAEQVDLVHYDSDKTYAGRMYGYPLLWRALVSGGVFISDDIQDNFGFRDFAAQVGQTPAIVESGGKYVGLLRKP
jgi:predicted O-methyltransferase YrrM